MTFLTNMDYRSNWPWQHKRVLFMTWLNCSWTIYPARLVQTVFSSTSGMHVLSFYLFFFFFFFLKYLSHCEAGKEKHVLYLYCLFSSASAVRSWTITFLECLFLPIFCSVDFKGDSFSSPELQNRVSGLDPVVVMLMGHLQSTELGLNNI